MGGPESQSTTSPRASRAQERFAWIAFAVALAVQPVLLWRYAAANSATFDEPQHLAAGYSYWHCGDYGVNPEHPPLAKLIATAPLRNWRIDALSAPCGTTVRDEMAAGYDLINGPHAVEMLTTARRALLVVPLLLLVTVFFAVRSWFGPAAAGWAVLLTLIDPNLTAHSVLVTTDMGLTAATLLSVFCAWRLCRRLGIANVVFLGLALGLALSIKHSGALVPIVVLLECLAYALSQPQSRWRLAIRLTGCWVAACLIAVALLWGVYQFRYSALAGADLGVSAMVEKSGMTRTPLGRTVNVLADRRLLPEAYLYGLIYVVHNTSRSTFLFGHELPKSVWYYYPVVLAIKTPLTTLLLLLAGLAMPSFWKRYAHECIWLGITLAVFLAFAIWSGIGLGLRHIMPVYPCLIVLAAGAAARACSHFRWGAPICAVLVLFGVFSYARSFPNEIAYANEAWGGPAHLRFYLGDSNLDWSQTLYLVKDWVLRHEAHPCWIAWFGLQKPQSLGIPCEALAGPSYLEAEDATLPPPVPERFEGTVLINVGMLDYDLYPYRWFRSRAPDDVIGAGVLAFHGDFDRPEVAAERRMSRGWWLMRHDRPTEAAVDLALAERHANARPIQEWLSGWARKSLARAAVPAAAPKN